MDNQDKYYKVHKILNYFEPEKTPTKITSAQRAESKSLVWSQWWERKMQSNADLIIAVKQENYSRVVQLLDHHYMKDEVASPNF